MRRWIVPKKAKPSSMEEQLRKLGAKLDDLIDHARKTSEFAKKINVEELLRQKAEVEKKMKDLKGPAREAWKEIETGLQGAWKQIRGAADRAKDKFKKK
jgi:hypothetical protein